MKNTICINITNCAMCISIHANINHSITTGNGNDRSKSKKSKKCARTGTGSSNGNSAPERCTSFELNNGSESVSQF